MREGESANPKLAKNISFGQLNSMQDLTGKLLVAMPGIGDDRFNKAVILVCAHQDDYAMGLILNKPIENLSFADLLDQLGIEQDIHVPDTPILDGGPVGTDRGFVLHSGDYYSDGTTMDLGDDLYLTATQEILTSIAQGGAPSRSTMTLGYAGWGPRQLEDELGQNAWLVGTPDDELVFGTNFEEKWERSLQQLGIDAGFLHSDGGHA